MMHNLQRYCFTPQTHQACRHVALCSLAAAQLHAATRDTLMLQPTRDRTHMWCSPSFSAAIMHCSCAASSVALSSKGNSDPHATSHCKHTKHSNTAPNRAACRVPCTHTIRDMHVVPASATLQHLGLVFQWSWSGCAVKGHAAV